MARNFANKLWNASRFVIMNIKDEEGEFLPATTIDAANERLLQPEDKWIISATNETIKKVTETMEKFDLGQAGQKVYEAIWNQYCDWYIEIAKGRLYGSDEEDKKVVRGVLLYILKDLLKILHPFMPFITEEIWGALPGNENTNEDPEKFLMKTHWPSHEKKELYPEETKKLEMAMEIIRSVRNIRAEVEAPPSKKLSLVILSYKTAMETARAGERYIKKLANITNISFIEDKEDIPEDSMSAVTGGAEIFIPSEELIDYDAEKSRLTKEKDRLRSEVQGIEKKLADQGFVSKAPKEVISKEKEKLTKYGSMLDKVCERLVYVESKKKK
jgi:valyl-tRNA synthetase